VFESPDQIYDTNMVGHEGFRMYLCTRGPKKLVLAHYKTVVENQDAALALAAQAITAVEQGDYSDIIGLCEQDYWQKLLRHD
jgi:hypothetical protein